MTDKKDDTWNWDRIVPILSFPATRVTLALLALSATSITLSSLLSLTLSQPAKTSWLYPIMLVPIFHLVYHGYVRIAEGRHALELSWSGAVAELGRGMLVGAAFLVVVVGLVAAVGFYRVVSINPWSTLMPSLATAIMPGYTEEVIFRGVLLRIIEESLGTWIALLISSALFGLVHVGNPGATIFSTVAIFLEGGVLLGAAYIFTRKLWMAIGIHSAWNFTLAGIFGVNVSGLSTSGLLESRLSGPGLIAGGNFGLEASIFSVAIGLAIGAVFLAAAQRRGHFVKPFWDNVKSLSHSKLHKVLRR